jgi:hypothetical protein
VVGYLPVINAARYGVQTGVIETAFLKFKLPFAKASILGVLTLGSPE